MERNILLTIEYDGTDFHGWQRQPGMRTVQGELEKALSRMCAMPIQISGTSRTDAGVHALGQRASFNGDFGIPTEKIKPVINNLLSGNMNRRTKVSDLRITEAKEVPSDFHARFNAKGKKYRYIIRNSNEDDIFRRNYCYQISNKLDICKMREAAEYIVGERDFACFQAAGGSPGDTTVRNIYSLNIITDSDDIIIEIAGNGFLYNMVRIIVGTLTEIGQGKIKPTQLTDIIKSADRRNAGHTAPAEGLYLVEVFYE